MLTVTLGERADILADLLAERLADVPDDPFAPEWVVVGSIGMRRWLSQRLAQRLGTTPGHSDGIAANIRFSFPGELRALVVGTGGIGDSDPWEIGSLQFHVLDQLAAAGMDPTLVLARRIADRFDRYHFWRTPMIAAWHRGQAVDGVGASLAPAQRWQFELWRRVAESIESSTSDPAARMNPSARIASALERLSDHDAVAQRSDLPPRLFAMGLNTARPDVLDVFRALSQSRPVEVMWMTPSVTVARRAIDMGRDSASRSDIAPIDVDRLATHPLMRRWAGPSSQGSVLLGARTQVAAHHVVAVPSSTPRASDRSALDRLKGSISADQPPEATPVQVPGDATRRDPSITLHACAGATRQAEVARDAILHLLADDPTLAERDIAVVSPDVDRFAALVGSAFGPPGERLAYTVVARSAPIANQRVATLLAVLDLVGGRFTAGEVSSLASQPTVRRHFGFDHDDLAALDRWTTELAIRWGLDGGRRESFGVPASFTHNTWLRGMHSLLMGIALDESDAVEPSPLRVEGSDAQLAGRVAEFVTLVAHTDERCSRPCTLTEWVDRLGDIDRAFSESDGDREWEQQRLDERLRLMTRQATEAGTTTEVSVGDIRRWLRDDVAASSSSARLGDGTIVVCAPSLVRSVPYRAVVVLGLDDLSAGVQSSDDLIANNPQIGDHDGRADRRQQLLDVIMAAQDHLVVTFDGVDPSSGRPLPRSSALDELVDCLADLGLADSDGLPLIVSHPRLATAAENFRPDSGDQVWSFDNVSLRGAQAAAHRHNGSGLSVTPTDALSIAPAHHVDLDDAIIALTNAPRLFATRTLGVASAPGESTGDDDLVLDLDSLTNWSLGDALLEHVLSGAATPDPAEIWQQRGRLPIGHLGDALVESHIHTVDQLLAAADVSAPATPASGVRWQRRVDVDLGGGRTIGGLVWGVGDPSVLRHLGFSSLSAKHLIATWVQLLVVGADDPSVQRATVIGSRKKPTKAEPVARCELSLRGGDPDERRRTAISTLSDIVAIVDRAASEALPLVNPTSYHLGRALSSADPRGEGARKSKGRARLAWLTEPYDSDSAPYGNATDQWVRLFYEDVDFAAVEADTTYTEMATALIGLLDGSVELNGDASLVPT